MCFIYFEMKQQTELIIMESCILHCDIQNVAKQLLEKAWFLFLAEFYYLSPSPGLAMLALYSSAVKIPQ
jgi:hypothetical protein